jgi:hypothetical protein
LVVKTEEKGSDVNLAAYLLRDCFFGEFDEAVVISNDTDLVTPIELVTRELSCKVGVLNPHPIPARALLQVASFYKPIRQTVLRESQFAAVLFDSNGQVHKPPAW